MLIGLTGPSGARKTVAAKRLERRHGFVRLHAGRPVKEGVRRGFGLTTRAASGKRKDMPHARLAGRTPRQVMEIYGTGLHEVAPQATALRLRRLAMRHLAKGRSVAIDGVRSEAEAAAVRALGGRIWRMDNGKGPNEALPMDKKQAAIKADATVPSKGGKAAIRAAVDAQFLKELGTG